MDQSMHNRTYRFLPAVWAALLAAALLARVPEHGTVAEDGVGHAALLVVAGRGSSVDVDLNVAAVPRVPHRAGEGRAARGSCDLRRPDSFSRMRPAGADRSPDGAAATPRGHSVVAVSTTRTQGT